MTAGQRLVRRSPAVLVLALAATTLMAPGARAAPTPPASTWATPAHATYCGFPFPSADGQDFVVGESGNPVNDRGLVAGYSFDGDILRASVVNTRTRTLRVVDQQPSYAVDVNRRGDVAGVQRDDQANEHGFLRPAGGGPIVLIPTPTPDGSDDSVQPTALNDRGVVVGVVLGGGHVPRAFIWDPRRDARPRLLGSLGGDFSAATGINRAGYVVGSSTTQSGDVHPFVWLPRRGGVMTDLGLLPGSDGGVARDINDGSDVVGEAFLPSGAKQAFLWDPTTHRTQALAAPGGRQSSAYAINRHGAVAGQLYPATGSGPFEAAVWTTRRSTATVLPSSAPRMLASGINRRGLVVGASIVESTFWRPARRCS